MNQDYVRQKEIPLAKLRSKDLPVQISNTHLTKREKQILTLLGQGLSRSEVCELLDITRLQLRVYLFRFRAKL